MSSSTSAAPTLPVTSGPPPLVTSGAPAPALSGPPPSAAASVPITPNVVYTPEEMTSALRDLSLAVTGIRMFLTNPYGPPPPPSPSSFAPALPPPQQLWPPASSPPAWTQSLTTTAQGVPITQVQFPPSPSPLPAWLSAHTTSDLLQARIARCCRKLYRLYQELAELVQKVRLLCLLGRGRIIDKACNDPLIQASALSFTTRLTMEWCRHSETGR